MDPASLDLCPFAKHLYWGSGWTCGFPARIIADQVDDSLIPGTEKFHEAGDGAAGCCTRVQVGERSEVVQWNWPIMCWCSVRVQREISTRGTWNRMFGSKYWLNPPSFSAMKRRRVEGTYDKHTIDICIESTRPKWGPMQREEWLRSRFYPNHPISVPLTQCVEVRQRAVACLTRSHMPCLKHSVFSYFDENRSLCYGDVVLGVCDAAFLLFSVWRQQVSDLPAVATTNNLPNDMRCASDVSCRVCCDLEVENFWVLILTMLNAGYFRG